MFMQQAVMRCCSVKTAGSNQSVRNISIYLSTQFDSAFNDNLQCNKQQSSPIAVLMHDAS